MFPIFNTCNYQNNHFHQLNLY